MCGNGICQKCGVNLVPKKPLGRKGPQATTCHECGGGKRPPRGADGTDEVRSCQRCGEIFTARVHKGMPRKYCIKCRAANGGVIRAIDRTKVIGRCEFCSAAIMGHKRRFCGQECRDSAALARYHETRAAKPAVCEQCGESFMGRDGNLRCPSCRTRKIRDHNCDCCGKPFRPRLGKYAQYCSRECAFEHVAIRNKLRKIANCNGLGYFVQTRSLWHICIHCSSPFFTPSPTNAYICSSRCSLIAAGRVLPPDATRKCIDCGNAFSRFQNGPMGYRCEKCREEWQESEKRKWKALAKPRKRCRKYGGRYQPFDRLDVLIRDEWICQLCGKQTDDSLPSTHDDHPELDHVIPLSRGGDHTPENTQCLCRKCNGSKHAKMPHEIGVLF